jgi:hypothetical protein
LRASSLFVADPLARRRLQDGLITYEEFLGWMAKNPIALGFFTKIREV